MWEDETIVLVTSLKKRILRGKDSVRFSVISSDKGVPAFIKANFKEQVEKYITEESPLSLKSTPHFDLKPEDLKNLRTRFLDVLRQAARFPGGEIETILRDALILRMDYIVKPVDTMRRILFKGTGSTQYSDVEEKLAPFLEVMSYAEYVLKKCALKRPDAITNEDYSRILADHLSSLNEKDPLGSVLNDFSILINFLSETKSEQITRVDAGLIQDFLADRNHISFRRAIDLEVELGRKDFSAEDLEITIKRYLALKREFENKETEVPKAHVEEIEPEQVPEPEIEKAEKQKQEKDEDWVFDEIGRDTLPKHATEDESFEESLKTDEPAPQEAEEPEIDAAVEEISKEQTKSMRIIRRDLKEEEKKQSKEKASEHKKSARNTIRTYIDKKAEKSFVKKLFGGSQEDFEKLVSKLDEAESWRVAKILIDNELFKRDVDPFSREAIKLVDMVYGLYYPEESIGGTK